LLLYRRQVRPGEVQQLQGGPALELSAHPSAAEGDRAVQEARRIAAPALQADPRTGPRGMGQALRPGAVQDVSADAARDADRTRGSAFGVGALLPGASRRIRQEDPRASSL